MFSVSGFRWLFCAGLFGGGFARATLPDLGQVQTAVQASDPSVWKISVHPSRGANGLVILRAAIMNQSATVQKFHGAALEFPWVGGDQKTLLISSGGTIMNTWPLRVGPATAHEADYFASGMYIMTAAGENYSFAGFSTWNTFWSVLKYLPGKLRVEIDGEDRAFQPQESQELETITFTEGADWPALLADYAGRIADERKIKLKPRHDYIGWSTWDYYGRDWTTADVDRNMELVQKLVPASNLLQIDGGWWPQRGDYTLVRPSLGPEGMQKMAQSIRAHHLTPGIHFDGMRGDMAAEVTKAHPEYFLHDDRGAIINTPQKNDGDVLHPNFFDFSNPGAVQYMRKVAHRLRADWGYDYIKIDFLMFGLAFDIRAHALGKGGRVIAAFDPGTTSVERLHRALAAWRAGMGEDAYFLACSAPFGAVLGVADGLRTGYDIFPNFKGVKDCAEATAGMFYLNGKVIYNDDDYIVLRSQADEDDRLVRNPQKHGTLSDAEAEMWAVYTGLFGGTKLESDNLSTLRPERQKLFAWAAALPRCDRYMPLDYWSHGRSKDDAFELMLGESAGDCWLAIFNWSDQKKVYALPSLPRLRPEEISRAGAKEVRTVSAASDVTVDARQAKVFHFARSNYDELRHSLLSQNP